MIDVANFKRCIIIVERGGDQVSTGTVDPPGSAPGFLLARKTSRTAIQTPTNLIIQWLLN